VGKPNGGNAGGTGVFYVPALHAAAYSGATAEQRGVAGPRFARLQTAESSGSVIPAKPRGKATQTSRQRKVGLWAARSLHKPPSSPDADGG
jgi:hypothetical protein